MTDRALIKAFLTAIAAIEWAHKLGQDTYALEGEVAYLAARLNSLGYNPNDPDDLRERLA